MSKPHTTLNVGEGPEPSPLAATVPSSPSVTGRSQPAPAECRDLLPPYFFEPAGDGMPACIADSNGAIICEAKYDDFEFDPSQPESFLWRAVSAVNMIDTAARLAPGPSPLQLLEKIHAYPADSQH